MISVWIRRVSKKPGAAFSFLIPVIYSQKPAISANSVRNSGGKKHRCVEWGRRCQCSKPHRKWVRRDCRIYPAFFTGCCPEESDTPSNQKRISSADAGVLLLREVEKWTGLLAAFAGIRR